MKHLFYISVFASFAFFSCNFEGLDKDSFLHSEEKSNINKLATWRIKQISKSYACGELFVQNQAWIGYTTGYSYLNSELLKDSSTFKFTIDKKDAGIIECRLTADVKCFEPYPIIANEVFGDLDDADYLGFNATISNNINSKTVKIEKKMGVGNSGNTTFTFKIEQDYLASIPHGMSEFTIEIETELQTFFEGHTKVYPFKGTIVFNYNVPQLYESQFYFKSLTLNEEKTKSVLGSDNDMSDPAPEPGISVSCQGESVLFLFGKNSYYFENEKSKKFYHTSIDDQLRITIVDKDYGLNSNDRIWDTLVYSKNLEGTDYFTISNEYLEELLIYTTFNRKVN